MTIQPIAKRIIDARSVHLGRYNNPQFPEDKAPLGYPGERHLLLFGPNGSGKGTRLLVPSLLSVRDRSVIVVDPKGELTAITADFRRRVSDVVILNPFGVLGIPGSGFNPLAALDPSSDLFFDDAFGVGEALIKIEEKDPHWSESAQSLIVGFIMWEVLLAKREKRQPQLENIRFLLTEADDYKVGSDGKQHLVKGLRITIRRMIREGGRLSRVSSGASLAAMTRSARSNPLRTARRPGRFPSRSARAWRAMTSTFALSRSVRRPSM